MVTGDRRNQTFALRGPTMRSGQIGLGAGFVEKDQIVRAETGLISLPGGSPVGILFDRDQALFCA